MFNLKIDKVKIRVNERDYSFINYLIYNKINYSNLVSFDDFYILEVEYDDYKRISRRYETIIIEYYGKRKIKYFIKKNKYIIICFIYGMFLLKLLTLTIFDIKVNTSSIEIKNIILSSLKENGISKWKKKKSFNELVKIKEEILNNNEDKLEWIEIREKGSIYIVDVTPRVKENDIKKEDVSSIYALHDGVIKHIVVYNGTKLKEENEYVKKGEVIISGNIYKDDKIIDKVNAKGEVYGETWYFARSEVPFKYSEYVDSGKVINHYYLDIFGKKFTLTGKYDSKNTKNEIKLIISKPYLFFKLYRERKHIYKRITRNINENEAYKIALEKCDKEILQKLNKDEYIISKKVLKKEVNSSKMIVEVFFKVYENLGLTSNIDEKEEKYGSSN